MVDVRYLIYGLVDKYGSLYEMIVADNDDKALDLFKKVILGFTQDFNINDKEQVALFANQILYTHLCLICSVPVINVLGENVITINKSIIPVYEFICKNATLFSTEILKIAQDVSLKVYESRGGDINE